MAASSTSSLSRVQPHWSQIIASAAQLCSPIFSLIGRYHIPSTAQDGDQVIFPFNATLLSMCEPCQHDDHE
jgi:hypothetical protein